MAAAFILSLSAEWLWEDVAAKLSEAISVFSGMIDHLAIPTMCIGVGLAHVPHVYHSTTLMIQLLAEETESRRCENDILKFLQVQTGSWDVGPARSSDSCCSALSHDTTLLIPWLPTQLHRCSQDPAPSTSASMFNTNVHIQLFSVVLPVKANPPQHLKQNFKNQILWRGNTMELDQARKWALRKWASPWASPCKYQSERTLNWARLGWQPTEHCPFRHHCRSLNGVISNFKQHS